MSTLKFWLLFLWLAFFLYDARAGVVINEIFYNAPDDREDLEYIELHNSGSQSVDIGGWTFTKGIAFTFPSETRLEAGGFLVLCRNRERFREFYAGPVVGVFDAKLSNNGEQLALSDARGQVVDAVKYLDHAPWPMGADGVSGSLERITPAAPGDLPSNWASSPLSEDRLRPGGSPGQTNASFSAHFPPVIQDVKFTPENPGPDEAMTVEAVVLEFGRVSDVRLLYRVAGCGFEKPESSVPMKMVSPDRYSAAIPGQAAEQLIRFRIQAVGTNGARRFFPAETEPRPAFSGYVHGPIEAAAIPFAWIVDPTGADVVAAPQRGAPPPPGWLSLLGFGGGAAVRRAGLRTGETGSSQSAFIYFDPASKSLVVFDFVGITPRQGGRKIRFQKDQLFREMSVVNLIFENNERFVLAEPLAYEVYRRAGLAAPQSHHVRLWLNGRPRGYHLLVEQPNRAFLRRNKVADDGNLYKILWYERGVVGQHEKKTNTREGHEDIVRLVATLQKNKGDALWEIIRKHFDVEQVVNYFAVNTVLSHWDGFFNNYFAYHDVQATGKWTLYPWDQDKTWGFHDGSRPGEVFFNMPLTFGMEGDAPPGPDSLRGPGGMFGRGGAVWWRPGGYFSQPLLANPQFRKLFLARTKEILEEVYREEVFFPIIESMGERLEPEVKLRAELMERNSERALRNLNQNLQDLRAHLTQRRAFLLAQDEIRHAGK